MTDTHQKINPDTSDLTYDTCHRTFRTRLIYTQEYKTATQLKINAEYSVSVGSDVIQTC